MGYVPWGSGKLVVPDSYARQQHGGAPPLSSAERLYGEYVETIEKAFGGVGGKGRKSPRQVMPWVYAQNLYGGIRDPGKATAKTQALLRRMASTTIVRAVIETLIFNALRYMHLAKDRRDTGFRIVLAEDEREPSGIDKKYMLEMAAELEDGGSETERASDGHRGTWNRSQDRKADPLVSLASKFLRDSLTLDWAGVEYETGTNRDKYPMTWWRCLDAGMLRIVEQEGASVTSDQWGNALTGLAYKPTMRSGIPVEYVEQSDDGQVLREFAFGEVAVLVRNERSDTLAMGYGWPELASLVDSVVGMIVAIQHNIDFFTSDRVPPGIGIASGEYDEEWLREFLWGITQAGTEGGQMYKLPILFGDKDFKFQYTPFRNTEKMDMYWSQWLQFIIAQVCAAFRVASEEINFQAFLTRGGQLSGDNTAEKSAIMKSPGFYSLMQQLVTFLNRNFVSRWYADSTGRGPYRLELQNLQTEDEQKSRQMDLADLQGGIYTVAEIRAKRDDGPVFDPLDRELYEAIERVVMKRRPNLRTRVHELNDLVRTVYVNKGGRWAMWPNAPQGASQQVWMQEHQQELQPAGMEQPGMMGQEQPPDADEQRQQGMYQDEQGGFGQQPDAGDDWGGQRQEREPRQDEQQGASLQKAVGAGKRRVVREFVIEAG